jgi:hypothetical protein
MYGMIAIGAGALIVIALGGLVIKSHFDSVAETERLLGEAREAIATHEANAIQYEATIASKDKFIVGLQASVADQRRAREEADKKMAKALEESLYMRNVFADHDFDNLARKKPGLITKRMQRATANVFKEFEDVANSM